MVTIYNFEPPNDLLRRIRGAGMNFNPNTTIFTYGDAIYNPGKADLKADVIAHEETHMRQQREMKGGPDAWWSMYLDNPQWRLGEEIEAYAIQYDFFCSRKKDQLKRVWMLNRISQILASPMYGSQLTPEAASKMIKEKV